MRMIYGHGVAQIGIDDANYTEFPHSVGFISFKEEYDEYTSLSGVFTRKSKGYRAEIEIEIYNVLDTDWQNVVSLYNSISYTKQNGLPVWVRPRYDSESLDSGLEYECELVSDVDLMDLAKTPIGQKMTLVFRSKTRSFTLPTNTNNMDLVNWQNQNGTNYVDQSANVYQITN